MSTLQNYGKEPVRVETKVRVDVRENSPCKMLTYFVPFRVSRLSDNSFLLGPISLVVLAFGLCLLQLRRWLRHRHPPRTDHPDCRLADLINFKVSQVTNSIGSSEKRIRLREEIWSSPVKFRIAAEQFSQISNVSYMCAYLQSLSASTRREYGQHHNPRSLSL